MNYTNYFTFLGQIILHFWCILFYKFEIRKRKYIPILYKIQYFKDHFCGEAAIFKLLIIFLLGGGAAGIKTTINVNFVCQLVSILLHLWIGRMCNAHWQSKNERFVARRSRVVLLCCSPEGEDYFN